MPTNNAAWLDRRRGDLTVGPALYTSAGVGEIVIRNRAVAINPLDVVKRTAGDLMYRWLPYPCVLGEDVAGEIVEVGAAVDRFRVGDRVLGYAVGMEKKRNHKAEGGFQEYTVVRADLAAPIPDAMGFADAAVLPLAISTAASALFQQDQLGLRHPAVNPRPTGEAVVVWGGSTSVGSNAIQLAAAAGYVVVATASPRNHERARALGASRVFDYASPTVVADIAAALQGSKVAGVFAVGTGSAAPAVAVAVATGAKRVSMASPSVSFDALPRRGGLNRELIGTLRRLVTDNITLQIRCRAKGVRARYVWGSTLMNNEVGSMLWERYLPAALADGRHVASPQADIVGSGLADIQHALDTLQRGVSARKLVIQLS